MNTHPVPTDDELTYAPAEYLAAYYETPAERKLRELKEEVRQLRESTRAAASAGVKSLDDMPELLTADEAATALRTSRRNLHRWIASGRLHAVKGGVGGSSRVLVPRAAVAGFLADLEG